MDRDSPQTPYINLILIQVDLRVESCTGCQLIFLTHTCYCANKQGKHIRTVQTHRQVEAKSMQADTHAIDHV